MYGVVVTPVAPAAPEITGPIMSGGTFRFSIATENGVTYAAQYKHGLDDPNWTTFQVIQGNGSVVEVQDPAPAPDQRFYRVTIQ